METSEIAGYKKDLLGRKEALIKRIEQLEMDKQHSKAPLSADSEEQAVELQNDEVVSALDAMESNELNLVITALKKIEDGSYGECSACGEAISSNRLKAVPYASTCINCAK